MPDLRRSLRVRGLPWNHEGSPYIKLGTPIKQEPVQTRDRSPSGHTVAAEAKEWPNIERECGKSNKNRNRLGLTISIPPPGISTPRVTAALSPHRPWSSMPPPGSGFWADGRRNGRRNSLLSAWRRFDRGPLKYTLVCLLSLYIGRHLTLYLTDPYSSLLTIDPPPEREGAINLTVRFTPFFDSLDAFLSPAFNASQLDALLTHDHILDRAYRAHLRTGQPSDLLTPYWISDGIPDGQPEWARTINGSLTARGLAQRAADRAVRDYFAHRVRLAGDVLYSVADFHGLIRPPGVEADDSPLSRWTPERVLSAQEQSFRSQPRFKPIVPGKSEKVVRDVQIADGIQGLAFWVVRPMETELRVLEKALDATREFRWADERVIAGLMGVREGVGDEVKALYWGWVEGLGRPLQSMSRLLGADLGTRMMSAEERQLEEAALILCEKAYYADDPTELWEFWGRRGNAALEKLMVLRSLQVSEGDPQPEARQLYHDWKARRCDAQYVKDQCGYEILTREVAALQWFRVLMTNIWTMFHDTKLDAAKLIAEYTAENPGPRIKHEICCGPEPYWWPKPPRVWKLPLF
ncbi:hypothetical protein B0H67DRAFT_265478 [Lasiosphaeris hirsuta]|uniref:Uncharacterized protein n=1 Tax=Lasiosphaeris hirsuta TaxID=260670 RepID=A0AA40A7N3_9PEZI|nr:hypothetical protein B0H67DRAFT_265478 [Lasiosphaeris hirsuta]